MGYMTGDEKHSPSATSTLDVLWVLYDRILRIDPAHPDDDDRDRFLLSKGHGPMAYYAVLAAKGFIDPEVAPPLVSLRLAARPAPRPQPDPRRRDLVRLARPRPAARRRHGARPASARQPGPRSSASSVTPSSTRAAITKRSPSRRASSGPRRADRHRRSTTSRRRCTGPAASRSASSSRAGPRRPSTAAITTRSKPR